MTQAWAEQKSYDEVSDNNHINELLNKEIHTSDNLRKKNMKRLTETLDF